MATFVKHIPCPNCGSSDGRGVWSDGSEWCFVCRDYKPANDLTGVFTNFRKSSSKQPTRLPEDAIPYIPDSVKSWLKKYNLTKEEYDVLNPLYSFEKSLLIFPVYAQGELLMYQGRYFGDNPDHPKYLTYGAKDVLHIIGDHPDPTIVCTEDLISAVKVSTVTNAMPVWGSNIPLGLATRLSKRFKRLVIWLDMDKASESLRMASKYAGLFEQVNSVVTELDPKDYSHDEIRSYLA